MHIQVTISLSKMFFQHIFSKCKYATLFFCLTHLLTNFQSFAWVFTCLYFLYFHKSCDIFSDSDSQSSNSWYFSQMARYWLVAHFLAISTLKEVSCSSASEIIWLNWTKILTLLFRSFTSSLRVHILTSFLIKSSAYCIRIHLLLRCLKVFLSKLSGVVLRNSILLHFKEI